jgi:hypothetical protein
MLSVGGAERSRECEAQHAAAAAGGRRASCERCPLLQPDTQYGVLLVAAAPSGPPGTPVAMTVCFIHHCSLCVCALLTKAVTIRAHMLHPTCLVFVCMCGRVHVWSCACGVKHQSLPDATTGRNAAELCQCSTSAACKRRSGYSTAATVTCWWCPSRCSSAARCRRGLQPAGILERCRQCALPCGA